MPQTYGMKYDRIIFLDVDGVLNGAEWIHRKEAGGTWCGTRIIPEPARVLHRILEKTEAKVVLISSWRHWVNSGSMTPRGFGNVLKSHGIEADVVDALPPHDKEKYDYGEDRAVHLLHWLTVNQCISYVVLEDINLAPFGVKNQIRTDPRIGLIEPHIHQTLQILSSQEMDLLI